MKYSVYPKLKGSILLSELSKPKIKVNLPPEFIK